MTQAEQYDVVVVGSGGGALTGALLAARAGLRTVVVEKTEYIGGTSAYSGGACWLPGSDVQQRAGLPDSTEGARAYLGAVLTDPDQDKLDAFLGHAPALVGELEAMGIDFVPVPFPDYFDAPGRVPGGRSIQVTDVRRDALPAEVAPLVRPPVELDPRVGKTGRSVLSGGQALIARLAAAYVEAGGEIRTNLPVTGFVTAEDGRVVGAAAMTPEGPVELRAERGVLVAAGGFERNPEMRAAHDVPGDATWTMAAPGTNTGETIEAAIALGAASEFAGAGWFCPGLEQPSGDGSFTLGFRSGLMVDATGRRYANECLPYDRFGREMAKAPERTPSWYVFDSREGGQFPAITIPQLDPAEHLASGTWVRADSIAELAEAAGLPVDALVEQVELFNTYAEKGEDPDFGRGQDEYDTFFAVGTGPNKALVPCDQGPFYAARFVLSDLGTKGGLVTDEVGRVLREDGAPLPGLYASSNSTASMFGQFYPGPGAPLGSAMVFASLAVRHLIEAGAPAA